MTLSLVTGATGFLGTRLVAALLRTPGARVRCLVRHRTGEAALLAALDPQVRSRVEVAVGALAQSSAVEAALTDCSTVYHLAATLKGSPADMCLGTVVGTQHLLRAADRVGGQRRWVHVSSLGVVGVAALARGSLVDESTPLEAQPLLRDDYSRVKLRQEQLVRQHAARRGEELIVARPGVVYGPSGGAFSVRVGLQAPGAFLALGGQNELPLIYVDNCADALAFLGRLAPLSPASLTRREGERSPAHHGAPREPLIVHLIDDDLPSCREYLKRFRRLLPTKRVITINHGMLRVLAQAVHWYHQHSHGQLPAFLTPYRVAATWGGHRYSNARLKALGYEQGVSTEDGLRRTLSQMLQRAEGARPSEGAAPSA